MLSRLLIKNYALIDNSDIVFSKGLNIITGETGAGKSILMGALGLVLGNRAEGKQFYDDSKKCVIEGYFDIHTYGLQDFFQEHDLDYEQQTIIRRELTMDGKSRAFVNDSPVTLTTLKALGENLIDIHSQHATLQINTEDFQLFVLDTISGNQVYLDPYKSALKTLRQLDRKVGELQEELKVAHAELDYNQFLFDELEKINVQVGELRSLEEEQQQLENAEEIKKGLLASSYLLADAEQNILGLLKESIQQVQGAGKYLGDGESLVSRLQSTYIELKDIADDIVNRESLVHLDEARLDSVNGRLSDIYNLLKKHRLENEEELIALKEGIEAKLEIASNHDELLNRLNEERQQCLKQVLQLAEQLHENRRSVVSKVEDAVYDTLSNVGMTNAKLQVLLTKQDESKLHANGLDNVQFLFSANKGQALQPIHKVASGGELSRVMLAIKSLVAQNSFLPTIIFDEIDTGISGEVALRVGEVMEGLAENMQVIAITHLAQIASKGAAHFKVYKEDKGDKTQSNIVLLSTEQRVLELAQMLSGANPGEAALQHARDLLQ